MKKQLPARPNFEQLRKQAKLILKGQKSSSPEALRAIQEQHPRLRSKSESELSRAKFTLADAQLVIANEYGFKTWAELKAHVQSNQPAYSDADVQSLRNASGRGDLKRVAEMLDARPDLVNETGGEGVRTALHDAAAHGRESIVKYLLEHGADPNIRCEGDYAMPLHFAAEKMNLPVIRLLIEHGADPVGEGDYHELGVIGWATSFDYLKTRKNVVDYLIAHGAVHNIFSAVSTGEVEVIRKLVEQSRANLEKRMDLGNKRRMPLHLAVVKKQQKSLAALLELGANKESLDLACFTALDLAALSGETRMANILVDAGAKVRLPAAVALGRTRDVEEILRREPDCLKPGKRWGNLIVRAAERAPGHVIESLLRAGASVNIIDDPLTAIDSTNGYTPLHGAGWFGNASAASVLLKYGANVRARETKYHGTPAGWADYGGHPEVRDLILEGSVDIIEAVQFGLAGRINTILKREPEVLNQPFDAYGLYPLGAEGWYTPLAFAVIRGQTQIVRILLDHGADRTVRSPEGRKLQELTQDNAIIKQLAS